MAFVYNDKLPCYSWGGAANAGNSGALYALLDNSYVRLVPLPEYGPVRLYLQSTDAMIPVEATPCDTQIPWKTFCKELGSSASVRVYGLTLHGEIYAIEAAATTHSFLSNARHISRLTDEAAPHAFANVCFLNRSTLAGAQFNTVCIAVTKQGKAFVVASSTGASQESQRLIEQSLPLGRTAKGLWFVDPVFVLLADDSKAYVRHRTASAWNTLTGGLYKVDTPFEIRWNTALAEPTFSVPAPSGGGTTATIKAVWGPEYTNEFGNRLRNGALLITNTGSGYTSDQAITRAGSGLPSTGATASVFTETITSHADSTADGFYSTSFISNTGKTWRFNAHENDSFSGVWATETTPTNSASGSLVPIKQASWNVVLGTDGKIYTYTQGSGRSVSLNDSGPWQAVAGLPGGGTAENRIICAIDSQGQMFTWGGANRYGLYGDDSMPLVSRSGPARIASSAEWLNVWAVGTYFVALRKDAVCRDFDQPMEYWPDSYFS